jgi:hypothetical protein
VAAVRLGLCAALVLGAWLCGPAALAQPEPDTAPLAPDARDAEPTLEPSIGSALAAIGPGFLVRGAGTFVAGDRLTARRLLFGELAGVLGIVGGGAVLATSGASRKLIGVGVPIVLAGSALFFTSYLADLYGAITGGRDDHAPSWSAPANLELGYRYVYDPQFRYASFAHTRADLRLHALRLSPEAWVALDDDNQRLRVELAYRLHGPRPTRRTPDGSYVDLSTAFTSHRYASDDFAVHTSEFSIDARFDLAHVGRSLRGAFVEGSLGAGLELYDFAVRGASGLDGSGLLLGRFGFGVYFGVDDLHTGELLVYYDHRHDDFAAGLGVQGLGGGFLGHLGASGHFFVSQHWAATLLFEVGSAYVSGLGVRHRWGGP